MFVCFFFLTKLTGKNPKIQNVFLKYTDSNQILNELPQLVEYTYREICFTYEHLLLVNETNAMSRR